MNNTSIVVYKEIIKEGKVSEQAQKILDVLKFMGSPLSGREIMKYTGIEINAVSGRVNDLKKIGRVVECEQRPCSISKRTITPVRRV